MTQHRAIIAILRGITSSEIEAACTALSDNGIARVEVPLNSPDAITSIGIAAQKFGGHMQIGAGTVLTNEEVDAIADAGGTFIVSPNCNPAVIEHTRAKGLESYPGVMTPTEALAALAAGANGLKFFPADIIGPSGIAAIRVILPPKTELYAVGGAGPDNFGAYFAAGCIGFGLGSYIYKPGFTATQIAERAQAAVTAFDKENKLG